MTDVIIEEGCVHGVITETGEKIRSRIVINAEGSQGLVAVKSGIRKRYHPDTISLADVYDYEIPKEHLDKTFGFSLRFCWGWDEQRCAPPLGYGNGLMVWPYRESIHYMHDQCLRTGSSNVPNLKKLLAEYHSNITSKLPWWKEDVASHAKLRGHMWEGFEIYVGLKQELRSMPNYTGGMLLVGDTAGLESTEMCDGVPQAWISADIAADVAIDALKADDTSPAFLSRYDKKIKAHPILQWSISGKNRFNLRYAQQEHDLKKLKKLIHSGWGLSALKHVSTPLLKTIFCHIIVNPLILVKWRKMFYRYYFNWHHGRFDYSKSPASTGKGSGERKKYTWFRVWFKSKQIFIIITIPLVWMVALLSFPFTRGMNPAMKILLPVNEPVYAGILKTLSPLSGWLSRRKVDRVANTDPSEHKAD